MSGTYRGVPAHVRQEQRRQTLIDAALTCLHDDGLAGISVRSVCARARLTPRYFYESFADLDTLLVATIDAVGEEIVARGVAAIARGTTPDEMVRGAIDAGYGVVADDPRKAAAILICAAGHGPLRERRHALVVRFAEVVLDALPFVGTTAKSPHALALFLLGGAFEVIEAALSGALRISRADLVDTLTGLWLAELQATSDTLRA